MLVLVSIQSCTSISVHCRQFWAAFAVRCLLGAGDSVIYSVMPLYHSSGSQIGTACSMVFGNKTIIKAKFSARSFFKDCAKYNATVRQYFISLWHKNAAK